VCFVSGFQDPDIYPTNISFTKGKKEIAMKNKPISRRDFMRLAALFSSASVISACSTPTEMAADEPTTEVMPTETTPPEEPAEEVTEKPTATPKAEPTATTEPTEAPQVSAPFVFPIASEPPGLDPCNPWYAGSAMGPFLSFFYDGWLYYDQEANYHPWLLKSYEKVDDLTWLMEMESGVMFHSGREAKAIDVQRCWERFIREDLGCSVGDSYRTYGESITAVDDYKFEIKLKEPNLRFVNVVGLIPTLMDMDVVEAYDKGDILLQSEAGTGPWMLEEWVTQTSISMVRFDDYWGGKPKEPFRLPKIERLEAVLVPDTQAQIAALRTDQIHLLTGVSIDQFRQLEEEGNYQTFAKPSTGYYRLNVNWFRITDENVRQALRYGMNRQLFVDALTQGLGVVSGPISPVVKAYALPQDELLELQKYDPELAKEYLAKAGYDAEENRLRLELVIIANWSNWLDIAQIVQANYKEVGIDIEIRIQEVGVWVDSRLNQKDYDLSVNDMGTGFDPDLMMYRSDRDEQAWTGGGSPEIDALLDAGLIEDDVEKRIEIYRELQRLMITNVRELWIYSAPSLEVWSKKVKGNINWATGLNWRIFDMEDVEVEA
jgi:peptide/nickel transport system substrate-binding protein